MRVSSMLCIVRYDTYEKVASYAIDLKVDDSEYYVL